MTKESWALFKLQAEMFHMTDEFIKRSYHAQVLTTIGALEFAIGSFQMMIDEENDEAAKFCLAKINELLDIK